MTFEMTASSHWVWESMPGSREGRRLEKDRTEFERDFVSNPASIKDESRAKEIEFAARIQAALDRAIERRKMCRDSVSSDDTVALSDPIEEESPRRAARKLCELSDRHLVYLVNARHSSSSRKYEKLKAQCVFFRTFSNVQLRSVAHTHCVKHKKRTVYRIRNYASLCTKAEAIQALQALRSLGVSIKSLEPEGFD